MKMRKQNPSLELLILIVVLHNLSCILVSCFDKLYKIEDVKRVDSIPDIRKGYYAEHWKIVTEIEINGQSKPIELYFGFLKSFPYTFPDVYFPSKQFGYLPHIESMGGKLCLINNGVSHSVENPYKLICYCLHRSKLLIKQGVNGENIGDFDEEINSYWSRKYIGEPNVLCNWLIYGEFPTETCRLKALSYKNNISEKVLLFSQNSEVKNIYCYLKKYNKVTITDILFVKNISIPHKAPYTITLQKLLDIATSVEDRSIIKQYVSDNKGGAIVFQLSEVSMGGVWIGKVNCNKNGFRKSKLTACDMLLRFDGKHRLLQRIYGNLYSSSRIAMRTAGIEMTKKIFIIAGLGSVGSNLTYFLSGWNNVDFTLIDDERLQIENIGRHLLGFQYIDQNKAEAVADYLYSVRPERNIKIYSHTFQTVFENDKSQLDACSALFLCTGDAMTEKFVVDALRGRHITNPTFILWLEPFGIAGHLVYINPMQMPVSFTLYDNEANMLYKYNLLAPTEYRKHAERFTKRDAGCNGEYALYSGNDVVLLLSALYPYINQLIQQPGISKCYRWIGNINTAREKGLSLTEHPLFGSVEEFPL